MSRHPLIIFGILIVLGFSEGSWNRYMKRPQVVLSLYYETMCPGCRAFTSEQICPALDKMGEYFGVDFVPYGNAVTQRDNKTGEISIRCQHGPDECIGNRIQSCALKHLSYEISTKFICCMESSKEKFDPVGSDCASKLGIDVRVLKNCADGQEGNRLHYLNGVKTAMLKPKHTFVPWPLFNGKYNKEDQDKAFDDLISVICKYLDDPKPRQCNEVF